MLKEGVTLTIVRPPDTSWESFNETEWDEKHGSVPVNPYHERADKWLHGVRQYAQDISDGEQIPLDLQEWQLTRQTALISQKLQNVLSRSNILVTINPSDAVVGYLVSTVQYDPTIRAVIGFDSDELLVRHIEALTALRVRIFTKKNDKVDQSFQPRVFSVLRKDYLSLRRSLHECFLLEQASTRPHSYEFGIHPFKPLPPHPTSTSS